MKLQSRNFQKETAGLKTIKAKDKKIKLLTQLYGGQLYIVNAIDCSLVWPATFSWNPYTTNEKGHSPFLVNSLFEDNTEFGYGIFNSLEARRKEAHIIPS